MAEPPMPQTTIFVTVPLTFIPRARLSASRHCFGKSSSTCFMLDLSTTIYHSPRGTPIYSLWKMLGKLQEFFPLHFQIMLDDLVEQAAVDFLPAMVRDECCPAVRMLKEHMAPLLANELEPYLLENFREFLGVQKRKLGHASISICCRPRNLGLASSGFLTLR